MREDVARLECEHDEVVQRLNTARQEGDLSENGAYKYAKFELGRIRRELGRLKHLLKTGYIARLGAIDGTVRFGCRVTIADAHTTREYLIVSHYESDPAQGKLSMESPLGAALMGKHAGDVVQIETPRGPQSYKIDTIQ